ncbi:RNA polymerase sigma factor [Mechercharimyces sp. CAU 1602]|uniref:RNA polymerase sigma factor n=1 Tax=Mechercharimyces sp. CAU 1602 TaxID=2973933 RepID=UPI002162F8AB|nr:RNA polymerase sigma factor [Mechercharimyces sp. CAU 1602]MCS1350108.1 RNA polymerase sigma factor [Mechercharimyces sp. CAU 1602]
MGTKETGATPDKSMGTDDFLERLLHHYRYLYHIAYRLTGNTEDAKDLTQETMWQAHRKSNKYVYEKSLKAWLRTMMTNRFRDQKRKKSLKLVAMEDAFVYTEPSTSVEELSVEEQVEQRLLLEQVNEEIAELPDIYQRVIDLRHFHGLSYTEISEALDIPEGTVKTQLFRARKMLKDRLSKK